MLKNPSLSFRGVRHSYWRMTFIAYTIDNQQSAIDNGRGAGDELQKVAATLRRQQGQPCAPQA
jgi:hypothetical protein